jgi:hypothetical protein
MIRHRCKICLWWDREHPRMKDLPELPGIPVPGLCRKHRPGMVVVHRVHVGVQPVMDAEDLCGEFREDKEK